MANGVTGYQQLSAASLASAVALTVPAGTERAWLQAETANVRYRTDGNDPDANTGMLLVAGAAPLEISQAAGLSALKAIAASGSPKLNITYFGSGV